MEPFSVFADGNGNVDKRQVQAHCDRNQCLDPLLLEATTLDEDTNMSKSAPLSPALLRTAQQVTNVQPWSYHLVPRLNNQLILQG
jgi:hypothetical protein